MRMPKCPPRSSTRRAAGVLVLALLLSGASPPPALGVQLRGDKTLCKRIRQAVQAGRTLDQIMVDFEVDARRAMKCTQTKGKKRKQPATKPGAAKRSRSKPARGGKT